TLLPYTTLFRSRRRPYALRGLAHGHAHPRAGEHLGVVEAVADGDRGALGDPELLAQRLEGARLGDTGGGHVQPGRPADRVLDAMDPGFGDDLGELLRREVRHVHDHAHRLEPHQLVEVALD